MPLQDQAETARGRLYLKVTSCLAFALPLAGSTEPFPVFPENTSSINYLQADSHFGVCIWRASPKKSCYQVASSFMRSPFFYFFT